jgi:predicted RNA-binding protein (virulence factor B family)
VGLLPRREPQTLSRGQAARFRVTLVHPDGKIELSLRGHAHEEMYSDGEEILQFLKRPGAPKLGDKSDPEQIRRLLGLRSTSTSTWRKPRGSSTCTASPARPGTSSWRTSKR